MLDSGTAKAHATSPALTVWPVESETVGWGISKDHVMSPTSTTLIVVTVGSGMAKAKLTSPGLTTCLKFRVMLDSGTAKSPRDVPCVDCVPSRERDGRLWGISKAPA